MNHASSLSQRIADLVHPRARANRLERLRHEHFVRARLPVSLAAAVGLPAYLALGGVPGLPLVLALACLMAPLAAVTVLSRTGDLRAAESVWIVGLFAFVTVLVAGFGVSAGTAGALLFIAPLEACLAGDLALLAISAVAAGALSLALPFTNPLPSAPTAASGAFAQAAIFAAVLAYACAIMVQALRLAALERDARRTTEAPRNALDGLIGDLVLHHDRSGAVVHVGAGSCDALGVSARDLAGRGFFERVHVADRPTFLKALSDATRDGGPRRAVLRLRGGTVASRHGDFAEPVFHRVEWRGRRIEADGREDGPALVALVRDLTDLAEATPATPAPRADAAWQDRFLATVSHELRTPLNAIIGFSEMLAHPDLAPADPAKAREYASIIHTSGQHLLSVVNTILDASKLESGRFEVQPESFDVAPLVNTCRDMMSLKAEQAGIDLEVAIAPEVHELVADARACKQILINLLSNAVKFTPAGGRVRIAATVEGQALVFAVSDTGIGIGAPDLPRLGDAFFQARSDYARPFEGTGLGLSVVRGLVGLHGGTISIESAQGEGTLVTVRLPRDGRPATGRACGSARIETIARRREAGRAAIQDTGSSVKKIA